jgi:beta-glucosidase
LPQGIEWVSQIRSPVNAMKEGLISEAGITTAVKSFFADRFKLRMFDPFSTILSPVVRLAEHSAPVLKITQESIVLLQNDGTLPLTSNTRVSVFGANADDIDMLWGNYDGFNIQGTNTILEGLRSNPGLTAHFTEGCDHVNTTIVWIDLWENITIVFDCQTVAWLNGSFYPNANLSCAPSVTTMIPRPRWRDGGESSLRCGSFLSSNYSVRFVSNCTVRQTEVLKVKYSLRFGPLAIAGRRHHSFEPLGASRLRVSSRSAVYVMSYKGYLLVVTNGGT